MDTIITHENQNLNISGIENANVKQNKTKEYILRAQRNYYHKRKNDANYKESLKKKQEKYINNNKEEFNKRQTLYMQEYRKRQKAAKLAEQSTNPPQSEDVAKPTIENITDAMATTTISGS
jgi:hypothetical protein